MITYKLIIEEMINCFNYDPRDDNFQRETAMLKKVYYYSCFEYMPHVVLDDMAKEVYRRHSSASIALKKLHHELSSPLKCYDDIKGLINRFEKHMNQKYRKVDNLTVFSYDSNKIKKLKRRINYLNKKIRNTETSRDLWKKKYSNLTQITLTK